MGNRMLILGIDGATFDVMEPLAKAGKLPNLSRLMNQGSWGPLRSTIHPLTPQAWATFVTGTNPGKHGIFDFGYREKDSYQLGLSSSATRRQEGFWKALARSGKTFGALNIPLSYPPEPVNGFMVTGMHTPTIDKGTYPADLYKDLMEAVPGYRIDVMCHWYEDYEPFLKDVEEMMRARLKAALYLYKRFKPDVFCPVFVGVDRVQHALWGYFQEGGESKLLAGAVARSYMQMDEIAGELIKAVGPETNILVMSDHGFGDLKKDVYLNHFLAEAGYLKFDPAKVRAYNPPKPPKTDDPRHSWYHGLMTGDAPLPGDDEAISCGQMPARYRSFETVDWSRTVAYSHGLFGNVFLNVRGREPDGIVTKGKQYKEIREKIHKDMAGLKDPDDGEPLMDRIYRREELYWGQSFENAPDLLMKMRGYSYMTRGACEFLADRLTSDPVVNHTGNHRLDGVLIAHGPDMAEGVKINGAGLQDLAPTVCYGSSGVLPIHYDGQVLVNIYNDGFLRAHDRGNPEPVPANVGEAGDEAFDQEEAKLVRERLRGLGYLG